MPAFIAVPATYAHVLAVAVSPLPRPQLERLAALVGNDRAVAVLSRCGTVAALAGLYTWPDGAARECWLRLGPEGRERLLPVLRCLAAAMAAEPPGPPVVARIRPGNGAGERLARIVGLVPAHALVEGAELWRRLPP